MKLLAFATIVGIIAAIFPNLAEAESSSASYILWADGVTSGGNRSTSTNYIMQGSVGDLSNEESTSANYWLGTGFEAVYEEPIVRLTLSDTSIPLSPNTLSVSAISTGSLTATVATNADFGYALTLTETSAFQNGSADVIDDVTDGAVTIGDEEFGVAISGTDAAFGDDQGLSPTPLTIATRAIWGNNRAVNVTFKAAIDTVTPAGQYSGLYTFIATGTF